MPLLPLADRVALEDEPPCTFQWFFARERKRKADAATARRHEAVAVAKAESTPAKLTVAVPDDDVQRANGRGRSREEEMFEQAAADLAAKLAQAAAKAEVLKESPLRRRGNGGGRVIGPSSPSLEA